MLRFSEDLSPADWVMRSAAPWTQVALFGPPCFPAYARLRFLPDPEHEGQRWSDAPPHLPAYGDGREGGVWAAACAALAPATRTPETCYFGIWEGYADVMNTSPGSTRFHIPNRGYYLYGGSLVDVQLWVDPPNEAPAIFDNPPAMMWPSDHAWFIACDTESHWAGIGATSQTIADLKRRDDLDVVESSPATPQPFYHSLSGATRCDVKLDYRP